MFSRILTSGLIAGAIAGFFAALLQLWFVQPVLLQTELYESGALSHFTETGSSPAAVELPGFDLMRDGLSVLFTMLVYAGYGLILTALMAIAHERGVEIDLRHGMLWGVAGFVALQLGPGFSLPPEVPGVAAADIGERQVWWFGTVAATGLGLWCIAFGRGALFVLAGAVLILAPHLIGAPEPATLTGPAPTELGALFAARSLGTGLVAWVVTGALAGWLWSADDLQAQAKRA